MIKILPLLTQSEIAPSYWVQLVNQAINELQRQLSLGNIERKITIQDALGGTNYYQTKDWMKILFKNQQEMKYAKYLYIRVKIGKSWKGVRSLYTVRTESNEYFVFQLTDSSAPNNYVVQYTSGLDIKRKLSDRQVKDFYKKDIHNLIRKYS